MKVYLKILVKDNKGEPIVLFMVLLIVFVIMPIALFSLEYAREIAIKNKIENAVTVSAMASLYRVTPSTSMSDIEKEDNTITFINFLKQNLNLNDDFTSKDNLTSAPIEIAEIQFYGADELPATCPEGKELTLPCVHVVIKTKIKRLYFRGNENETDVIIHKDIDVMERGGY